MVRVHGTVVSVEGALVPRDASAGTFAARRDLDGHVVHGDLLTRAGGAFTATLDAGRLIALGDTPETWELLVGDLPLARLEDDVPNAAEAYVFPAARPAGREVRPR